MVKIYVHTKLPWDISIHCWDKTTSGFGKGTAAILELCFLFRFWPIHSRRQVILHQPVKFRHNRTIGGEVMTLYRFFKMAVIESEIYFRFRFWWWHSLGKIGIYWHAKFWWDISMHGWDKTTSGFGKRTSAILEFYFRFWSWPMFSPPHMILLQPAKFCSNPTTDDGLFARFQRLCALNFCSTFSLRVLGLITILFA